MANVDNANGFSFERRAGGGPAIPLERGTVKSNTDIAAGDSLMITLGLLIVGTAGSTDLHGISVEALTGKATAQGSVAFYPATPDSIFSGQTDGNSTVSDVGVRKGILGTTGIQEIDSTGATTSVLQIVGLKDGSTFDSQARLLFTICRSTFTGMDTV